MKFFAFFRALSALQITLAISILVHAVLLSIRFVDPEAFSRIFKDMPLEVILVNAKSNEKPEKAQAIAQASLAGGGSADAGRATTPLPFSALTSTGNNVEESQKNIESMHQKQMLLLAQLSKNIAALTPSDPNQSNDTPEAKERELKRQQMLQLLAEIEQRINEENARPRKRFLSPATMGRVHAIYYDALRIKVEAEGTRNFPQTAGRKLYGSLIMSVTVNHDGQVLETRVEQSSGNKTLDRQAEAIVKNSAPFGYFDQEMRKEFDQMVVIASFKFTREETLETEMTSAQ